MLRLARFSALSRTIGLIFIFTITGMGCSPQQTGAPQQRVILTNPMVFGRSPDELHIAWAQLAGDGKAVLAVDGQIRSGEYDEIGTIVFSSDSQTVAYSVKADGKWRVMINEEPGPEVDEVSLLDIAFSPNGEHLTYSARRDNKWYAFMDGKVILAGGHEAIQKMKFSADSRHFAYRVLRDDKQALVIDGVIGSFYDKVNEPLWSPDGKRVAYIVEENDGKSIVLNGRTGPKYDEIASPVFSFDGRHFAYGASKNGKSLVVTDGKDGPVFETKSPIDSVKFAPADPRLGYVVNKGEKGGWVVVIDGKELAPYAYIAAPSLSFSPNGKGFAFVAAGRYGWKVVDEKGDGPSFDGIVGPVYSRDGGRIAYGAVIGKRLVIYVDSAPPVDAPTSEISDLSFSPEGKHLAYRAIGKDAQFIVLDGRISPAYDKVYKPALTAAGVEYMAERESDGYLWRGFIPFATGNKDETVKETKIGWLPTKESLSNECSRCEKQKELLNEENE